MPTALPAASEFTSNTQDEGDMKAVFAAQRDFLAGLLGTDGFAATALATLGAPLSSYAAKTGAYSVVLGDKGKTLDCSGTWTLSLLAAATAGDGYTVAVRNGGTGVITLDPNLSETIDGGATMTVNASESLILYCNGSAWIAVGKSSGVPSGSLMAYGGGSAPAGWLLCDGSAVSRTTYASLFTAISTTFGVGDGSTTFNLPDARGRVLAGKDNMGGTAASRITSGGSGITGTTLGATGGAETHTLTGAQSGTAAHTHGLTWSNSSGSAGNNLVDQASALLANNTSPTITASAAVTEASAASASVAHNNTQPTLIANTIIKT